VKIRERLIWLTEKITGLALFTFIITTIYIILLWTLKFVSNPEIPIHGRIAIGSGITFFLGLFIIFLADIEDMGPF